MVEWMHRSSTLTALWVSTACYRDSFGRIPLHLDVAEDSRYRPVFPTCVEWCFRSNQNRIFHFWRSWCTYNIYELNLFFLTWPYQIWKVYWTLNSHGKIFERCPYEIRISHGCGRKYFLLSSRIWHRIVRHIFTNVSKETAVSIFRVQEIY
jgi:hypothetical protein